MNTPQTPKEYVNDQLDPSIREACFVEDVQAMGLESVVYGDEDTAHILRQFYELGFAAGMLHGSRVSFEALKRI